MARRRLTPIAVLDVPHAEHSAPRPPAPVPAPRSFDAPPIAHVAADAAATAAAEEIARTLATARETGRLVLDLPLEAIAADHLTRDRLPVEDEEMVALKSSLAAHGQRTPIEVTPLTGALPYGLISGWRRLSALKALLAETGDARFATIQALIRRPETLEDAYVAMVEENEVRVGLSPYERARVAALATARGVFPSEKAALLTLFATASRPKRSRIRAFLEIYHALDGVLRFPAHLPERLGLTLVETLREEGGGRIAAALAAAAPETADAERAVLEACLAPEGRNPEGRAPDRPREDRVSGTSRPALSATLRHTPRPGLRLEARLDASPPVLMLRGPGLTPALVEEIAAFLSSPSQT